MQGLSGNDAVMCSAVASQDSAALAVATRSCWCYSRVLLLHQISHPSGKQGVATELTFHSKTVFDP